MKLDVRTMRLIAVGASITANCQPCLQISVANAITQGISEQEIAEAIEVGKRVRHGAASKMDKYVISLGQETTSTATMPDAGCGCN
jgi:AhpD family alkylhydroperoxidase